MSARLVSREDRKAAEERIFEIAARDDDWDERRVQKELARVYEGTSPYLPDRRGLIGRAAHGDREAIARAVVIGVVVAVVLVVGLIVLGLLIGDVSAIPVDD